MNFAILFLSVPLQSQSIWQVPIKKDRLEVEVLKSHFDDWETSTITSVLFLAYHHAISQNLQIVAELPFAHIGLERSNRSETSIGNPYLGIEIRHKAIPAFIEVGIRAKLAPEELDDSYPAAFMAVFTEIVDRSEAFAESTFSNCWGF